MICQILCHAKLAEVTLSVMLALRLHGGLTQLPFSTLQELASFNLKFAQILSLIPIENTLKTTLTIKQDLFTNSYENNYKLGEFDIIYTSFIHKS